MPDNDRTKTRDPRNLSLDDLVTPRVDSPIAPVGGGAPATRATPGQTPDLGRASGAQTRAATANVTHTDQMRDLMNRMRDVGDDEISDEEAARRAGLAAAPAGTPTPTPGVEPRPPENLPAVQNTLPKTVQQDLENISKDIKARDGKVYPKWHEIKNLPGYMQRAIRAMGRGMFKMFTTTDLEDIITIANVGGNGPNSNLEMQAVADWLQKNAEDLGASDIDFSQVMPGYNPEVKEYRTNTTRFHVVRDPFGVYIYAYPEQDAVEYSSQPAITGDVDSDNESERDEYGALIQKRLKETTMTNNSDKVRKLAEWIAELGMPIQKAQVLQPMIKNKPISEANQIKWHKALLEDLNDRAVLHKYGHDILEEFLSQPIKTILETQVLDEASTLVPLLRNTPGGPAMARYLHLHTKIAASAEWDKITGDDRVQLELFKQNPNFHMIIIGDHGVATASPDPEDFKRQLRRKGGEWQGDNTLKYRVIAFKEETGINHISNPELFDKVVQDDGTELYVPKSNVELTPSGTEPDGTGEFTKNVRVDHLMVPNEYATEVGPDGKKKVVRDANGQLVVTNRNDTNRQQKKAEGPPTFITVKRGGNPAKADPQTSSSGTPVHNFFDQVRGVIGRIRSVYITTSQVRDLPRADIMKWKKYFKSGLIPGPVLEVPTSGDLPQWPPNRTDQSRVGVMMYTADTDHLWRWDGEQWSDMGPAPEHREHYDVKGVKKVRFGSAQRPDVIGTKRSGAKVWDPEAKKWVWGPDSERVPAGTRVTGASAADIAAARAKQKTEPTPGTAYAGDVGTVVAKAMLQVFRKFMHKKTAQLADRIRRATAADNDDVVMSASKARKTIKDIMIALDTSNPNWTSTPLLRLARLVKDTISSYAVGPDDRDAKAAMDRVANQLRTLRAPAVKQFWEEFMDHLDKPGVL